jgi:hypothetical protein
MTFHCVRIIDLIIAHVIAYGKFIFRARQAICE